MWAFYRVTKSGYKAGTGRAAIFLKFSSIDSTKVSGISPQILSLGSDRNRPLWRAIYF
jgi:hypothetical protein